MTTYAINTAFLLLAFAALWRAARRGSRPMSEITMMDEMDRIERVCQRLFARCSMLEARVNELERQLAAKAPEKPAPVRRVVLLGARVRPQGRTE